MDSFKPNSNFIYYLYFICERQDIFWRRYNGEPKPYTEDPILNNNKFTNVYRVLDRSSQFLLKNVIYNGDKYSDMDMAWRIVIYKHFNLPQTWEALIKEFGDITLEVGKDNLVSFFREYSKDNILYSNAYMITAAFMRSGPIMSKYKLRMGMPKYESYLNLFDSCLIKEGTLEKIINSRYFEDAFNHFKSVAGVADFLAYQLAQDINYTDIVDWDDNSFCAAGPGTQRGIERTFDIKGKPDYQEIVKWVKKNFSSLLGEYSKKYNIPLDFKPLPGHLPRVPDFSNCFCETSKYLKTMNPGTEAGEKRMKSLFYENKNKIEYIFPTKWHVKI